MNSEKVGYERLLLWQTRLPGTGGAHLGVGAGALDFVLLGVPFGQTELEGLPGARIAGAQFGGEHILGQNPGQLGSVGNGRIQIEHISGSSLIVLEIFCLRRYYIHSVKKC